MDDLEEKYALIAEAFVMAHDGVEHGNMMRTPALTWGGKVFAFHSARGKHAGMGFRLGRDYDFASLPTKNWTHLAPFKTKPPMKDWIMLTASEADFWPELALAALEIMRGDQ